MQDDQNRDRKERLFLDSQEEGFESLKEIGERVHRKDRFNLAHSDSKQKLIRLIKEQADGAMASAKKFFDRYQDDATDDARLKYHENEAEYDRQERKVKREILDRKDTLLEKMGQGLGKVIKALEPTNIIKGLLDKEKG